MTEQKIREARSATLVLDNGMRFKGKSFGYEKPVSGEVVFRPVLCGTAHGADIPAHRKLWRSAVHD